VGLRAGLDGCGKSRPPPRLDARTVQPVASRYNGQGGRAVISCTLQVSCSYKRGVIGAALNCVARMFFVLQVFEVCQDRW
jgi:hypothetical protein